MIEGTQTVRKALSALVGRELASVEFVRDYIQLRFDGPLLEIYVLPAIVLPDQSIVAPGTGGYADALVACIGSEVRQVDLLENQLTVAVGAYQIQVALMPNEDEAALFVPEDGPTITF